MIAFWAKLRKQNNREDNNVKWRPHHIAQETSNGSTPSGKPPNYHHCSLSLPPFSPPSIQSALPDFRKPR